MPLTCPRCLRILFDSANPAERPLFCMYCGQRLRGTTTPTPPPAAVMPDPAETVDSPTHSFAANHTPDTESSPTASGGLPAELGGYRLGKFLGAGGMGTVYEAEAVESGQRVALKVLSGRLASSPSHLERFRQEGRVASQISHPHCVFVFRADADAGHPYIVMELMPGRTLTDLVEQHGPLPHVIQEQRGHDEINPRNPYRPAAEVPHVCVERFRSGHSQDDASEGDEGAPRLEHEEVDRMPRVERVQNDLGPVDDMRKAKRRQGQEIDQHDRSEHRPDAGSASRLDREQEDQDADSDRDHPGLQ